MAGVASAKLAGALNRGSCDEEWPPPPIFAGDTLVRLKKARGFLRDALAALANENLVSASEMGPERLERLESSGTPPPESLSH